MTVYKRYSGSELTASRINTATLCLMLAIGGLNHGIFETLQGFTKTPGLIIQAIGPANRMWLHGTEEAFSIIPNFLITGILAICVSVFISIWSAVYIQKAHGRTILFFLFVLLFLFGGGIAAQIAIFPWIFGYAVKVDEHLAWWKKHTSAQFRAGLAKIWKPSLIAACIFFLSALEMAIFGYIPGMNDPEVILYTCWSFLLIFILLINLSCISGYLYDIERQNI